MKKSLITAAASLAALSLAAQKPSVQITASTAPDNSLVFDADVTGYGTFTIRLDLYNIRNAADQENRSVYAEAFGSDLPTRILSVSPLDGSKPAEADFQWNWIQGKVDAAPDLGFVYRLPVPAGRITTVRSLTPSETGMMRDNLSNFIMWQFSTRDHDQVFAIRKGKVIFVQGYSPDQNSRGGSTIIVEHADGTQARYAGLMEDSATVIPGDTVYPDTPIALAGTLRDGTKGVHVGLYHYVTNRNTGAYPGMMTQTAYINPLFLTNLGENILIDGESVTSKVTKKLVRAESGRKSFWDRLLGR